MQKKDKDKDKKDRRKHQRLKYPAKHRSHLLVDQHIIMISDISSRSLKCLQSSKVNISDEWKAAVVMLLCGKQHFSYIRLIRFLGDITVVRLKTKIPAKYFREEERHLEQLLHPWKSPD